jgi:ATP-binding protein involved in chromosome partitioning
MLMKIAVPAEDGVLSTHFGQCRQVILFTIDELTSQVAKEEVLTMPPHEPGVFPAWLSEQGADIVIAGGMGPRAVMLFTQAGVRVLVGAPAAPARQLVEDFLAGRLTSGANVCTHGPDHECAH